MKHKRIAKQQFLEMTEMTISTQSISWHIQSKEHLFYSFYSHKLTFLEGIFLFTVVPIKEREINEATICLIPPGVPVFAECTPIVKGLNDVAISICVGNPYYLTVIVKGIVVDLNEKCNYFCMKTKNGNYLLARINGESSFYVDFQEV